MATRGYVIVIHRDGELASRQLRVRPWVARLFVISVSTIAVALLAAVILYGPTVAAAARAPLLQRQVERLTEENARVADLARRLDEVEARYAQLRGMLGGNITLPGATTPDNSAGVGGERLYVAPAIAARVPAAADSSADVGPSIPHRWPLSVRSYRTRGLAVGDPSAERHNGIDLAVPVGSDVRASGGGVVRQTGVDSSYGQFVLLQHPDGYETMYGHLSRIVVTMGDRVNAGQVIGLSGNTGRSTAPHLHFEVRRRGESVDPLTLVHEEH